MRSPLLLLVLLVLLLAVALVCDACAMPPAAGPSAPVSAGPRVEATTSPTAPSSTRPAVATLNGGPIQLLDARTGFATTETGLVGTRDGGVSWERLAPTSGAFFSTLRFIDGVSGWAIAQRWAPDTMCLAPKTAPPCWSVMATNDGGRTWTDRLSVPGNQLGTPTLGALQAIDARRAWVVVPSATCEVRGCVGELRVTSDGGATWTTQLSHVGGLGPLRFASASRGWIAAGRPGDPRGGMDVLASADGGTTWTTALRVADQVLAIDAASEREAWVLARDGSFCTSSNCSRYDLVRSVDGGATWVSLGNVKDQATCSRGHLLGPLFASPTLGWMGLSLGAGGVSGGDGGLMRTRDAGRSWDCRSAPANVNAISAADPQHLWVRSDVTGSSLKGATPVLMASDDGGDTWRPVTITLR